MKKIGTLNPGTIFTYAKKQFVVLESMSDGTFCLLAQSSFSVPFHDLDEPPGNNYAKSSLRGTIEGPWLDELFTDGGSRDDLVPFDVDLRPTDQSEGYGTLKNVLAAPLTLWQYGKYKDIIPLNEDWWWLVTPCTSPWLNSPHDSNACHSWHVDVMGGCEGYICVNPCCVRPALKLNSELLVPVEEDTVDLSQVNTIRLLKEIERRYRLHLR